MILKTAAHIFIWIGRSSEESAKLNGLKFARQFHDIEPNLELVVVNDGYEQSLNDCRKADWSIYLPLTNRRVKPLGKCIAKQNVSILKLYQCGFVGGKYRIEEKKSSAVDQSDINDKNSAFIVDCAERGVWIWLGRHCSARDKSEAMRNARGFVRKVRNVTIKQIEIHLLIRVSQYKIIERIFVKCIGYSNCRWFRTHRVSKFISILVQYTDEWK